MAIIYGYNLSGIVYTLFRTVYPSSLVYKNRVPSVILARHINIFLGCNNI